MTMKLKPLALLSLSLALPTFLTAQVTSDWTGGSGDWDEGTNWSNGIAGSGDTARIGTQNTTTFPATQIEITVDDGRTIRNLHLMPGLNHVLIGDDITFESGGQLLFNVSQSASTNVPGGVPFIFDVGVHLLAADATSDGEFRITSSQTGGRIIRFNEDVTAGETTGTVTLRFDGGATSSTTFNGNLLDHADGGTLRVVVETGTTATSGTTRFLGSGNTFSGGLVVNSGSIIFSSNNGLGTGDIVWNKGGFIGSGTSAAPFTLNNNLVWNGDMVMDTSGIVWTGTVTLGGFAGAAPHLVGSTGGRTQTFHNIVDGGFDTALRFSGGTTQTLRLINANPDWSGGLIQESGTLRLEHSGALGTGTWVINGGSYIGIGTLTVPNAMEWNSIFRPLGTTSGGQTFTGDVVLGANAALNPTFINETSNVFTFAGSISDGGHNKPLILGANTTAMQLELTGNNTFTGGVVVEDNGTQAKTLRVGHGNSLGTGPLVLLKDAFTLAQTGAATSLNLPNAIELDASITLGSFAGWQFSGPVSLSTADNETVGISFAGASNVAVFSGVVTDATNVTFVKTGAGTLAFSNNSNAIDGTLQVDGGGIQIGAGGASGQLGSATIELASGASLIFNRSDTFTVANEVSGAGGLIARGGDAELTGTLSFTGNSTVEDGATLRINTTYDEGSTFNVQSGGTFGGTGTIGGTETPTIELAAGAFLSPGGATAPGTLTLDTSTTTLDLTNIEGTGLGALIFRLGSVSDSVDGGQILFTNQLGFTDFTFTTVAGFGQGTYILFDNMFTTGSLDDDNLTGMVGGLESTLSLNGSTLSLTVIPEPGTVAAIFGVLALGLAFWRRRQKGRELRA